MLNNKQDLRILKTQYLLTNALFKLLKTNVFSHITVNDICTEAMVSRSAFYAHFEDKFSLLRFSLDTVTEKLKRKLEGKPLNEYIFTLLDHVKSNKQITRNIIKSDSSEEIREIILRPYVVSIEKAMIEQLGDDELILVPHRLAAFYHASGIISIIFLWVNQNLPYSVDEMAKYLVDMLPYAIRNITMSVDD